MVRRKCVLRACPHHHYGLEKIGGNIVRPHSFPRSDYPAWSKWQQFVIQHNGSMEKSRSRNILCSAHFQPNLLNADGTLSIDAVPTISPEFVRLLALKHGDVSPSNIYPLPEKIKSNKISTPVIFLKNVVEGYKPEQQQLPGCQPSSSELRKRKRINDLCECEFICPVKTKVGLQIINDTLRIWGSLAKANDKEKVDRKALKGNKVIEIEEECGGNCYNCSKK
ncbi:uncharacterized protein LOC117648534 [Thrips palmi]|uniref:Uncharacterized protein LOC117648534 n=1 Tax=Thrips palmi TaxID=161013 RepID=A0A6P8Z8U8_THRPL|nr:uncharacterized protein LOC117648534 [Thrips palmi]